MKTEIKKYYICEICGKKSQDEEKIRNCAHLFIDDESQIEQKFENGKPYPRELTVRFSDGAVGTYNRNFLREAPDLEPPNE